MNTFPGTHLRCSSDFWIHEIKLYGLILKFSEPIIRSAQFGGLYGPSSRKENYKDNKFRFILAVIVFLQGCLTLSESSVSCSSMLKELNSFLLKGEARV